MGQETIVGQLRPTMTDRYISEKQGQRPVLQLPGKACLVPLEYTAVMEQQRGTEITMWTGRTVRKLYTRPQKYGE
jgi:hypothetical protein